MMSIDRQISGDVFEPAQIAAMSKAFEDVVRSLGLVEHETPLTEIIAKKIIELARAGEQDPAVLRARVLTALAQSPNSRA
jgi:hypothetical protein